MPHALFVFAHQDDEVAAATRMMHLLREGWTISVAFLTNGELRAPPHLRDAESRAVLSRMGIDMSRVHFIGSEERIADGGLLDELERALRLLEQRITENVDAVYCLAWEGGHHDHDASHLIAVTFASRRGILDSCFEMPLYHGRGLPGVFFRALAPLRTRSAWTPRTIPLLDGLRALLLCRFYRSQRKTWLAVLPEGLARLVVLRREWTRPVDLARLRSRPHEGPMYYERRFGVTWEQFREKARTMLSERRRPGG